MINQIIKFLKVKLAGYSFLNIFRMELEGWLFMLTSPFPGMIGFTLRCLLGKLLFKDSKGFQWLQPRITFVHADRISIGSNVGINTQCYLNGLGGIEIEDFVLIGNNVTISSGKHDIALRAPEIFDRPSIPMKIRICKGVWIGAGAVIMPSITLGEGCVIGANSVVTKDTEPYSINVGTPSKCIGYR